MRMKTKKQKIMKKKTKLQKELHNTIGYGAILTALYTGKAFKDPERYAEQLCFDIADIINKHEKTNQETHSKQSTIHRRVKKESRN